MISFFLLLILDDFTELDRFVVRAHDVEVLDPVLPEVEVLDLAFLQLVPGSLGGLEGPVGVGDVEGSV